MQAVKAKVSHEPDEKSVSSGGSFDPLSQVAAEKPSPAVTALAALLVYQKFGLALLRRSWVNLDLIWAIALVVTGLVALAV